MKGDEERYINCGFIDYLSKPIAINSFFESDKKAMRDPHN